jgi:hypothetical protein
MNDDWRFSPKQVVLAFRTDSVAVAIDRRQLRIAGTANVQAPLLADLRHRRADQPLPADGFSGRRSPPTLTLPALSFGQSLASARQNAL